jgi:membrane protein YdbS with pleckstrin-like domain
MLKKQIETLFYAIYKMPPEPQAPAGRADSVRIFHASPKLYYLNLANWFIRQLFATAAFFYFLLWTRPGLVERYLPSPVIGVLEMFMPFNQGLDVASEALSSAFNIPLLGNILIWLELLAMAFFLLQLPFSYAFVVLDYKMRWYIVTDRSLRIRAGVNRIRELTMTYANIQNLSIQQNILQQFLGIADLKVQTAGGAASEGSEGENAEDESIHVAYFKGVDNAQEIRDLILNRLHDESEAQETAAEEATPPTEQPPLTIALLDNASQLEREAGLLKEVVGGEGGR